ncbi:MAG: hypothetical protein K2G30_02715, partial [Muribaculaceae bacterium]|nr:hypothetical protein [Muribaculaceae bacterium]
FTLWSRDQFLRKVEALTAEAISARAALLAVPLADYSAALEYGKTATRFYPTLFDFACGEAVDNLRPFDNGESVLNVALLDRPFDNVLYPSIPASPLNSILTVYNSWGKAHADDEAVRSMVLVDLLRYIGSHLFGEDGAAPLNDRFMALYNESRGSDYAGTYLLAAETPSVGTEACRLYHSELKSFIDSHPGYYDINAAKNRLNEIEQKSIRIGYPEVCAPGRPFEIEVTGRNISNATLKFYDVTKTMADKDDDNYLSHRLLGTPAATATVEFTGEVPFRQTVKTSHSFAKEGRYVVVAAYDGMTLENNVRVMRCTNLSGASVATAGKSEVVAVDVVSGKPQSGVEAWYRPWSRRSGYTRQPGMTDSLGILEIKESDYGSLQLRRGNDRYAPLFNLSSFRESGEENRYTGALNTALGLYRPGDTVDYSIVLFERDKNGAKHPAAATEVTVTLRDANYQ